MLVYTFKIARPIKRSITMNDSNTYVAHIIRNQLCDLLNNPLLPHTGTLCSAQAHFGVSAMQLCLYAQTDQTLYTGRKLLLLSGLDKYTT